MRTVLRAVLFVTMLSALMLSACTGIVPIAATDQEAASSTLRLAFPSVPDVDDVPALIAADRLEEQGVNVETTFYSQGELATAALAQGDADIGFGSATAWLTGNQEGAPIVGIMDQAANGWSVFAVTDIAQCADLDGRRVAIHSEGAVGTAMLRAYIDQTCPGTEPAYLVIPGSENRAAALLAGEIDATPVELADAIRLDSLRPGEFVRLTDFAVDLPDLLTTGVWANRDTLSADPETIKAFVRELLKVHSDIAADPAWFVDEVIEKLEIAEADQELLPAIIDAKLATNGYDVMGGLTPERAEGTLAFFIAAGRLEPSLTVEKAFDFSILNQVLE